MSIVVHHLENSRSQRVLWLLEELGLEYEVRRYARDPKTMLAPPTLRQVHPLGKSPTVTVDGIVLIETGAIAEFFVDRSGGRLGAPAEPEAARRYRQYLHYAEGSLMPPLLLMLMVGRLGILGLPARSRVQGMIDRHLDWLETELSARSWFASDDFTAADVLMSFPLEAATRRGGLDAKRPQLMGWLDRIHARPAYAQALERGGPYAFA